MVRVSTMRTVSCACSMVGEVKFYSVEGESALFEMQPYINIY